MSGSSALTKLPIRRYGLGSAVVVAMLLTGCGEVAENLLEEGVEKAIENDSGEDVELDFNGEDGIRIETDEGTMTIDGEGNMVIVGEDGETITAQATEDGVTVTDGDGEEVLNIDDDNGQVTTESGEDSFTAGPGMPEQWPNAVPKPAGLEDVSGTTIVSNGNISISITGTSPGDAEGYFDEFASTLEDAGFTRSTFFEGEGIRQGTYEGTDYTVSVFADGSTSTMGVTITSAI